MFSCWEELCLVSTDLCLKVCCMGEGQEKNDITISWVTSGQCGSTTSRLTNFNKLPSHSQKFALLLFFKLPIEKLCPFAISQTNYSKMVLLSCQSWCLAEGPANLSLENICFDQISRSDLLVFGRLSSCSLECWWSVVLPVPNKDHDVDCL